VVKTKVTADAVSGHTGQVHLKTWGFHGGVFGRICSSGIHHHLITFLQNITNQLPSDSVSWPRRTEFWCKHQCGSVCAYRVQQKYLTIWQHSCEWNHWRGEFVLRRPSSETQSFCQIQFIYVQSTIH